MSRTDAGVLPRGSGRILTVSTVALSAAAAVVLTLGAQDARLLRLGLVAALWAALLGAFAAARARYEAISHADRSDQLRAVYQLELEREVAARREHARAVERELREQAELSRHGEIMELRAELAAMRKGLEQRLGADPVAERTMLRAESTRLPSRPSPARQLDDNPTSGTAQAPPSCPGPEPRFDPVTPSPAKRAAHNSGTAAWRPAVMPATPAAKRTVNDLLAAHEKAPRSRRRRSHDDGPATSGEGRV